MRATHYVLSFTLLSLVVYLLVSWYVLDGPNVINHSYRLPTNDTTYPDGTMDNLFWFVQVKQNFCFVYKSYVQFISVNLTQVSDLHISKFGHQSRASDFRHFCNKIIPSINPSLVIVTGNVISDVCHV